MEVEGSGDQDRIGVFMTAIMPRQRGGNRGGEKWRVGCFWDRIGVFMTAIMSRWEGRDRERRGDSEREKTGREPAETLLAEGIGYIPLARDHREGSGVPLSIYS